MPTVSNIENMDRGALVAAWDEIIGAPVPKRLSSPFIRRFLAFEVQARARGRLPKAFPAKLAAAVRDTGKARARTLKPGGRLIREWNGMTHVVDVREDGFIWNRERFASLSPIACAITGTRWSGPRFFGTKGPTAS